MGTASSSESDLFVGKINVQLSTINTLSQVYSDILSVAQLLLCWQGKRCAHVTYGTVYGDKFPLGSSCTENMQILSRLPAHVKQK